MPSSAVSIVIPTWNGRRLLEEFLPSVIEAAKKYATTTKAPVEIVIVDDGSTDETIGWLADQSAEAAVPLRTIRHEKNLGFGAACNTGVHEAQHGLVFLLNNDVDVSPDAIAPLAARFKPDDSPFAVHCRVLDFATGRDEGTGKMGGFARGFLRVHRSYVARPDGGAHQAFFSMFASGGSAMFDRQKFLAIGGFDPLFAPFYMEDVELSYRAWKRGMTVEYEPLSTVRHRFSSTIGPLAARSVPRIGQRNRLIFHWIHLHDSRFLASHAIWVVVLLLAAPLTFKPHFIAAFVDAVRRSGEIGARRRAEKHEAKRTDRGILQFFTELAKRTDVTPYDDPAELEKKPGVIYTKSE